MKQKVIRVDFSKRGRDLRALKKDREEEKFWEKIEERIKMNVQ
jgi:hypothetical protein